MNRYRNIKIIIINLALILFGGYIVEFLITIKPYIFTSNNRVNFNKKIAVLQQESYEAQTHPFSVNTFRGSGSIIQYFSKDGIEVVERFSPTAPYIIENDGIKLGNNKSFPFTAQGNKLTVLCAESGSGCI